MLNIANIILIPTIAIWLISYFISIISTVHMINNKGYIIKAFDIKAISDIIKSIGLEIYIEFYVFVLSLVTGFTMLTSFIIMLISWIITIIISQISGTLFMTNVFTWSLFILTTLIMLLLLVPTYIIFESRAIASIYNLRE